MKAETTQCRTCGNEMTGVTALGSLCLPCVLRAGLTPTAEAHGAATTWAEVFPQLEVLETLKQETDHVVYRARVCGENTEKHAVLQVVSGQRLERAGGAGAVQPRTQRLAGSALEGVAAVLDFGDLADAFFLVTEAPAHPTLPVAMTGLDTGELAAMLNAVTSEADAIVQAGRASGVPLRFDPEISFVDPDTGQLTLTPNLLAADQAAETKPLDITCLAAGLRLGRFVLIEKAGEGGFGEVWRARQERPVKREVALKILKGGLHSQRARARFEVEQQALAKLDHPHISRFFDGDITPDGRPYFAMEWIEGQSLTSHCENENASLDERLHLFEQVCDAVHHAHQKGVIHRDLKPSNVMVATDGLPAAVKVIDFGIARALEDPLTDQTQLTRAEEIVGTPASMSPEQAAGAGGSDLDARSDVYGLGILLYELLTATLPFDPTLPADELRRRIREHAPAKPSIRARKPGQARRLSGDLDWIVMRCLEKDPARRYRSVSALQRDLERHANDEPVEAGPPALSYRVRKFVRRHKVPVIASAAMILALVVATGVSLLQMNRAETESAAARAAEQLAEKRRVQAESEKEHANLISSFLTEILQSPDPTKHGSDVKVVEVLENATLKLRGNSDMQPLHKALLLRTLGNTHRSLGQFPQAVEHLEESLGIYRDQLGHHAQETTDTHQNLVESYWKAGRYDEAETLVTAGLERVRRDFGPSSPDIIALQTWLAMTYTNKGDFQRAAKLLESMVASKEFNSRDVEDTCNIYQQLANVYAELGDIDRAIKIYSETLPKIEAQTKAAVTAAAHKLARILYAMVKHRAPFDPDRLGNPAQSRARKERFLRRQAEQLGFTLTPVEQEVS
jgi:tetratricopeptide (TPR) repeat protein